MDSPERIKRLRTIIHVEGTNYSIDGNHFNMIMNPTESDVMKALIAEYRKKNSKMCKPYDEGGHAGFRGLYYDGLYALWDNVATHEEAGRYLSVDWKFPDVSSFQCWALDISGSNAEVSVYEPYGSKAMMECPSHQATLRALHRFNKNFEDDFIVRFLSRDKDRGSEFIENLKNQNPERYGRLFPDSEECHPSNISL